MAPAPRAGQDDGRPAAKHERLRAELARWIRSELSPGDRLPGERRLVQRHGVSRITVRHALDGLQREGLLVREQGRGTFVAEHPARPAVVARAEPDPIGPVDGLRVLCLGAAVGRVPAWVGEHLGAGRAWHLRRLHLEGALPVGVEDCWAPSGLLGPDEAPADGAAALTGDLEALLADAGTPVTRTLIVVRAAGADAATARTLRVPAGAPVLTVHRRLLSHGRPVGCRAVTHRADRWQLTLETGGQDALP